MAMEGDCLVLVVARLANGLRLCDVMGRFAALEVGQKGWLMNLRFGCK